MQVTKIDRPELIDTILFALREKKGFDFAILDLRHLVNPLASYFVIASGNSRTQVQALADSVEEVLKKQLGERPSGVEGYPHGDWILIDYFDVVVHVFQPHIRQFYRIEELWGDAKIQRIAE